MSNENRVAVMTGGAGKDGMGFASARKLAEQGWNIALTDVPAALHSLTGRVEELTAEYRIHAMAYVFDVTEEQATADCITQVLNDFGRIDLLFNNAGIGGIKDFSEAGIELFDRMYRVNVRGPVLMCKAVAPVMQQQQSGVIINNASVAGIYGTPGLTHYCASKHAVIGFTKALAAELGKYNVRVLAICPGLVATGMFDKALLDTGATDDETNAELKRMADDGVSLGRWAQPSEIGDFVAYLASDAATYISGVALPIHGGFPMENLA